MRIRTAETWLDILALFNRLELEQLQPVCGHFNELIETRMVSTSLRPLDKAYVSRNSHKGTYYAYITLNDPAYTNLPVRKQELLANDGECSIESNDFLFYVSADFGKVIRLLGNGLRGGVVRKIRMYAMEGTERVPRSIALKTTDYKANRTT
ncbi:hypothetical protein AAVH_28267 [Aphelenchoides avenae]|nr:hypothetical protein AAVH_28267 [Aphelenchus avenae]